MQEVAPNPSIKDLEISKFSNERVAISIASGSVSPTKNEDPTASVKDSYLGSTQQHVFASTADLSYWSNIYDKAQYEGRHRLDPSFQWSSSEEKRLVRKVAPLPLHDSAESSYASLVSCDYS